MVRIVYILCFILVVSLTGCSRSEPTDENAVPPTSNTSSLPQPSDEIRTEPSPKAESAGSARSEPAEDLSNRLPKDFPLPIVEGGEILPETPPDQEGKNTQKVIFKSEKPFDELASYYEKALTQKGLEIRKTTQQQGDEKQFLILGYGEEGMAGIMIANKQGEKPSTIVLNWAVGKREAEERE